MKNEMRILAAAAALSFCGMTFAADEEMKQEQPAAKPAATAEAAKPAQTESKPETPSGENLRDMKERPKDLDLRHCLDAGDNTAIAKCAGE